MPSYPNGIPLLQYVDDTTISTKGSVQEARNLSTMLDLFTVFSGPQTSHAKLAFLDFL